MIDTFITSHVRRAEHLWQQKPGAIRRYAIGPICLEVRFFSDSLLELFHPAFACQGNEPPTHTLYALDANATHTLPPPNEWCFPESVNGSLQRAYSENGHGLATDDSRGIWNLYSEKTGLYWIKEAKTLPEWEPGAPFRLHIHWFAAQLEAVLLHAAGIHTERGALLLTGKGGSGKSTTTKAAIEMGLKIVGEDFLVAHEGGVHPIYRTLKMCAGEGKTCHYLPADQIREAPIGGICSLEFADHTALSPANPAQVLQALAPSSLFLLRTDYHARFHALAQLVQQTPCFLARIGPDPQEAVRSLMEEFARCPVLA